MYTESLFNDDDLVKKIRQIIKEELAWFKENQNQVRSIPENLVNIKRVIKELDVSKATIYNWLKKGLISRAFSATLALFACDLT
jgi:DNA invertase Pin-like site-specific DNA recombinase